MGKQKQRKSIWGMWWEPFRKWFYPAWLIYEISVRFYDYSTEVHNYFRKNHSEIVLFTGEVGAQVLDALSSSITFIGCSVFLTIPASLALHQFFKTENLTGTRFEGKMKPIF